MVDLKNIKAEANEHFVPKIKWYLKYRTQLWGGIFLVVGLLGGNVDRITAMLPSLKQDTTVIETKLKQLDDLTNKLVEIQKTLDQLKTK